MDLTEKTLSSEVIYRGVITTVQLDKAQLPNGATATREVVRHPNGVAVLALDGDDRVVLVTQYRYPLGDYIYEFPAGLVEPGEDVCEAGIREMYEETGLSFTPVSGGDAQRPFFTSVGMTDESCGLCFGYCSGTPSNAHQEDTEDIQVVLADRDDCRRILKEESVSIMAAYMMMHFIATPGDPLYFLKEF